MTRALIIWPHQLFDNHPGLGEDAERITLFEDPLFFGDPRYPMRFHKQKLWLHRASMAHFRKRLEDGGFEVVRFDYERDDKAAAKLVKQLKSDGVKGLLAADPVDHTAIKRLRAAAKDHDLELELLPSPGWLNTREHNEEWSEGRKRWFMAEYYKHQRRRLDILMDDDEPVGGKWSFDEDNRKKVPKKLYGEIPGLPGVDHDAIDERARDSVEADFPDALGSIDRLIYPTRHDQARDWFQAFLNERFDRFGDFEDAIVAGESWLWHAVLTPMLNIGLLTPEEVVKETLTFADDKDIPINALEGFIRQLIGWREFMRATYEALGVDMRTTNHWKHTRSIPASFYDGTTGIDPIDDTIQRILETGYCHHIERLMVLGGFMFLCEFDPDEVYRWFMEMFIDSYDWVMVPNVYAMSQHADGGLITTKPYFSGSNYIKKMSDWGAGDWADTWDGLYWRFIWTHREALAKNPRWAMMCRTAERMDEAKMQSHLGRAGAFFKKLDQA
jgi:deoxyribodipyrimidine photolyase-related protein